MSVINSYIKLLKFRDVMELSITTPEEREEIPSLIQEVEDKIGRKIPIDYTLLLSCFDGGELFVPGTIIYGLKNHGRRTSVTEQNELTKRELFGIPDNYLIIGQTNFGDYICINLDAPNNVIQWDHENDEEYISWDSIEAWIDDVIEEYIEYSSEE